MPVPLTANPFRGRPFFDPQPRAFPPVQLLPTRLTPGFAKYLSWQGRFEEAFGESERARQLDPLSLIIAADDAAILDYSRQYDRAIARCSGLLDMDPNFLRARAVLFGTLVHAGRFAEALNEIERWIRPRSEEWAWESRAIVYGQMKRTEEAERALARFEHFNH